MEILFHRLTWKQKEYFHVDDFKSCVTAGYALLSLNIYVKMCAKFKDDETKCLTLNFNLAAAVHEMKTREKIMGRFRSEKFGD